MNFKQIFALSLIPVLLLLNFSVVSAKNVALIVKDVNNLDQMHEQKLFDILVSMNHAVTLVDQSSSVNYNNFDLLVVAGRPASANPLPASFLQSLPVNSIPTIAIDAYSLYSWGWVDSGGVNMMSSGSPQSVYIASSNHPITAGYTTGQRVFVHNRNRLDAVDIVAGTSNFTFVAYLDQGGDGGIAFAAPNTQLTDGKSISSNSAAIFFGITFPAYWTSDAETLFRNSVNWITNLKYTPPTTPTLSGPSVSTLNTAQYSWTSSTGANGVQSYEIQISTTSDFSTLVADTKTAALSYTTNKLMDGRLYYVRVRAIDFLNLQSQWSNVISTIADFTPIILKINSPSSGTSLQTGQNVSINVSVDSFRVQSGSLCTINIDQDTIGTLVFSQSTNSCSGNITIPQNLTPGPSSANFAVSIQDEFGATNSTSIPVTVNRQAATSTTTTSTTTQISSVGSSVGTGSSGSSSYALLIVNVPTNFSYYVDSQNSFTITVKNEGNILLHSVKVWISSEGNTMSATIAPATNYDMMPGETKNYFVNVQTPDKTGDYYLVVKTLSYETSESAKRVLVKVDEKPVVVDFGITNIEIPDFTEGITSLTNITIVNKGNVAGNVNVNLVLPEGWVASSTTASVDIQPNQQATLAFEVNPSSSSGTLTFSGTFSANGTTKEFSYPVPVTAKTSAYSLSAITAALASTLGNPAIAVPAAVAVAVIIALYYKFKIADFSSKYIWPKTKKASYGNVVPKSHQKNNFAVKKTIPSSESQRVLNNAYNKWEKSSRRI